MNLREMCCDFKNWIELAQGSVHCRGGCNTVMNLRVLQQWISRSAE